MAAGIKPTLMERFLDSLVACLTPASARRIIAIPLDAATSERLEELRVNANQGQLTDDERVEYEELVEAMDLISLIKLKARLKLDQSG